MTFIPGDRQPWKICPVTFVSDLYPDICCISLILTSGGSQSTAQLLTETSLDLAWMSGAFHDQQSQGSKEAKPNEEKKKNGRSI